MLCTGISTDHSTSRPEDNDHNLHDRLNNKEVPIKPISPYKIYCSLGTEQGTSKNQKAQHGKRMNTSATHNRKLACSVMFPKCAWMHYSAAVFQSSTGYPLSMCHISQHQLHNLQKKYIPTLLNKIGVARTHAQVLVFDPRSYVQNFPQDQLGKVSSG